MLVKPTPEWTHDNFNELPFVHQVNMDVWILLFGIDVGLVLDAR
jgi:hypothetical protein